MNEDDPLSDSEMPDAVTAIHDLSELRLAGQGRSERDKHLLVRMNGADVGKVVVLEGAELALGRSPDADLWLRDDGVSRQHARVAPVGDGYRIVDCQSANGTFVEGQRIETRMLADGDVIQLGASVMFRYSITDADNERMLTSLYEASVRDPLTGCYNREHFEEHLKAEVSFARRHKTEVALVMLDLDHFKAVNDTYGHPVGDQVLIELVYGITGAIRLEDVLARYGGEEFVVVARNIPLAGTYRLAERLREIVAAMTIRTERGVVRPTASFGCATLSCCDDPSAEALVMAADEHLYEAKRRGRNCVVAES